MPALGWFLVGALTSACVLVALRFAEQSHGALGRGDDRSTYLVLETAETAAVVFRRGLTRTTAAKGVGPLRGMLAVPGLSICDATGILGSDGELHDHPERLQAVVAAVLADGRAQMASGASMKCSRPDCELASAAVAPIVVGDLVVGALIAVTANPTAALMRATESVARWVAVQVELSELHESQARLAESELRFLRAQISPHFLYNALTAIASFVRSDPNRARELLIDFADFSRYSFTNHGQFTTLADELLSIERYLRLEKARFGDRLKVTLRIAPEVLAVAVPFLVLQPLVENAVRHGIEPKPGQGHITITADDHGGYCMVGVEDDGVGMDPAWLANQFARSGAGDQVGIANVDERMRAIYGAEFGLMVDTALGAGTRAVVRIPKFRSGVRAS
jgi:two-component system, LytTR family, sensor kinase